MQAVLQPDPFGLREPDHDAERAREPGQLVERDRHRPAQQMRLRRRERRVRRQVDLVAAAPRRRGAILFRALRVGLGQQRGHPLVGTVGTAPEQAERAAGAEDPRDLGRRPRLVDPVPHRRPEHGVDAGVGEGERLRLARPDLDLRHPVREHGGHAVVGLDRVDVVRPPDQEPAEGAGAGAQVDDGIDWHVDRRPGGRGGASRPRRPAGRAGTGRSARRSRRRTGRARARSSGVIVVGTSWSDSVTRPHPDGSRTGAPSRKRVAWPQGPKGATMRDGLRIIDSDAHVIEPHELWTDYLDPALRHLAPRPVGLTFGFEFDDFSVNLPRQWSPDASPDELAHMSERIQATYAELFPDAYTQGFSAPAPARRHGPRGHRPRVPLPVVRAVRARERRDRTEARGRHRPRLQRLARRLRGDRPHPALRDGHAAPPGPGRGRGRSRAVRDRTGLPGAFVRPNPIGGRTFDDPAYEELWSVMSDHSMTLGIHEGGFPRLPQVVNGRLTHPQQVHICTHPMEQMISAVSLIYGGVLERCPGLKVAFLEAGCGWVPFWLHRMDEHWENTTKKDFGLTGITEKPPSEYFRRQCYVSAESSEYMLAQVIELIGDDRIVFTTDYPHPDSPWPHAVDGVPRAPGCPRREQAQDPVGQLARALRPRRVTTPFLARCGRIYRPERARERSGQVRSSSVRSTSANHSLG